MMRRYATPGVISSMPLPRAFDAAAMPAAAAVDLLRRYATPAFTFALPPPDAHAGYFHASAF